MGQKWRGVEKVLLFHFLITQPIADEEGYNILLKFQAELMRFKADWCWLKKDIEWLHITTQRYIPPQSIDIEGRLFMLDEFPSFNDRENFLYRTLQNHLFWGEGPQKSQSTNFGNIGL